ncbi:DNA repair protein RAD51 homolog 3-like [Ornithodoros turicata]|uniref:DNA repair protein RAD51 homolog 3-like n=1 Tax=Ornithodoros turicata TaxID=34597 RepID=UPI00313917EA
MSRDDLCPLLLPRHMRYRLYENGFEDANEVCANDTSFTAEAAAVQRRRDCIPVFHFHAASERLYQDAESQRIPTWIPGFDALLNGGIPSGKIFEVTGIPGSGKTQFCLQVAASNQMLGHSTFYISTKGPFPISRYNDILNGMIEKHSRSVVNKTKTQQTVQHRLCDTWTDLVAVVTCLLHKVTEPDYNEATLVIIDGLDFHFRYAVGDLALRRRLIAGTSQKLVSLAHKGATLLLTNHVAMKAKPHESNSFRLAPALGEVFGHECTHRVTFFVRDGYYEASFFKAPTFGPISLKFDITSRGIVDKDLLSDMDAAFSASA